MPNTNEGTAAPAGEAQTTEEAPAQTAAPEATGTPVPADEVTTLRSRNAGLDAKVTELTKARLAAEEAAAQAATKLAQYESGVVKGDEALRAQLQAKEAELNAARQEASLARIAAAYPETFAVLGDAAANMPADKLAEAEARFKGVAALPAESNTPPPVGNNAARPLAPGIKPVEDMTLAEFKAHAAAQFSNTRWSDLVSD